MDNKIINKKIYQWDLKLIAADPKWKNACFVRLPFTDLKKEFGKGNLVPINAIFDKKINYRGVISKYDNEIMLIVITKIQEVLNKHAGDMIHVQLQYDDKPRIVELPNELETFLIKEKLLEVWKTVSNSMQKEYVSDVKQWNLWYQNKKTKYLYLK